VTADATVQAAVPPAGPGHLAQQNSQLQQQVIDLRLQLEERDQDLATARSANRELMAQLNHALRRSSRHREPHVHNTCRIRSGWVRSFVTGYYELVTPRLPVDSTTVDARGH
jgi:hypothetical protein